jgi:hypothetical protein
MPEENKPESNPSEMAGPTRSAETARALVRKTKRATRRRFPTEDKIRIVMEGIRGEMSVAELCRREGTGCAGENLLPRNAQTDPNLDTTGIAPCGLSPPVSPGRSLVRGYTF